jgi:hypothetical protein
VEIRAPQAAHAKMTRGQGAPGAGTWPKRRQRLTAATIANARAIRASVRLDQLVGSFIQVTDTILQGLWCSSWQEGGVRRLSGAAHHFGDDWGSSCIDVYRR